MGEKTVNQMHSVVNLARNSGRVMESQREMGIKYAELIDENGKLTANIGNYIDEIEGLDGRIEMLEQAKNGYAEKYLQIQKERNSFEMNWRNEIISNKAELKALRSKHAIRMVIIYIGNVIGLTVAIAFM